MWDWLGAPIDPSRAHNISQAVAWHGRSMVLAWGVLAPLAVIGARFFKIMPGQNWPQELDSPVWWRTHWIGQTCVLLVSAVGLWLVAVADFSQVGLHAILGYSLLVGLCVQALLGVFRGSKGGPTAPAKDGSHRGDHYDMTPWRRMFEAVHKTLGYGLLALAAATILLGLWTANASIWMWLVLSLWWL
ncbi:MAG: cytochrome b561 domain-containing protein, partial [Pseudomonadota bacterium]